MALLGRRLAVGVGLPAQPAGAADVGRVTPPGVRGSGPRVALVTVGSRGDVEPFVALARGLQRRGADVSLAAPRTFAAMAQRYRVAFDPLPVDPADLLTAELGRRWIESGRDPRAFLRGLRDLADPLGEDLADAMIAACADADVIVYATLAFPAWHIADARGLPAVQVSFAPLCPTAAFPPLLFPDPFAGRDPWRATPTAAAARAYHRAAHVLFAQLLWLPLRRRVNRWRRTRLDAPPHGVRSPGLEVIRRGEPLLHAFSPTILPPPRDWGPHVVTTGAWFLDGTDEWTPPPAVGDFMSAGPPPVVVGLGSMTARDPEALTALVVAALRRARQRGLILAGWADLGRPPVTQLPDGIMASDELPHAWILPRAGAIVHHGGSGTTAAGLRAGLPSVVVPHFGDQYLWADRVHALGAGPPPIPRADLTVDRLAAAIRLTVDDIAVHRSAAAVGARIRAERGVARGVATVIDHAGR